MVQRCAVFGSCQPCENVRQVAELEHGSQISTANFISPVEPHLALQIGRAQAELRDFVSACHRHGQGAGLAGALRFRHLADLAALSPDYVGFRSAVCIGDRAQGLQTDLARALMAQAATWGLSRKRRPHAIDVPMGVPVSQLRSVST